MTGKFRAWDKKEKRYTLADELNDLFVDSDGLVWALARATLDIDNIQFKDVTDRYDIEWETGKQDKNGKEIYQSDRCSFETLTSRPDLSPAVVVWSGNCWMLQGKLSLMLHRAKEIEIIGTIHDEVDNG